jgi:adenosylhomocysteine nucleosidase
MKTFGKAGAIVSFLAALPAAAQSVEPADDTPRIAVMSAFAPEWVALQEGLSDREDHVVNGTTYATGVLEGKPVVLFLTGVSMVNAAMTTQIALDRFAIETIVFSGIAGGVDPELSIGDVIVPERWGQYLEAVFAREVDGTYAPPGFISTPYPNFGMIFPREVDIAREGSDPEERFWFETDPALLEIARSVAADVDLADCVEENACLRSAPSIRVGGNGVSGQAFVDNAEFREYVFETFEASVLDMESAAVAHVAYANGVPFIAFRSLSDLAGGGEGENEMATFMQLASDNSAAVVSAFVRALPD